MNKAVLADGQLYLKQTPLFHISSQASCLFTGTLGEVSQMVTPAAKPDELSLIPKTYMSVHMVDYIDGFSYVEPSLHPWDEAYFIGMDDFSDVFLDLICQYFIENFCVNVHEGYCFHFTDFSPPFDYFLASAPSGCIGFFVF
ncbi:hypothetical protein H671_6g16407 [Cricetulus griseus]|nr:hypothetical protein H671_6g16407 [Cricetulus griseus]